MYKFQYYPANIKKCKPLGFTTIEEFKTLHKEPTREMIEVFSKIAEAEVKNDMELKAKIKQNNLLYFTPCVYIKNWRKYDNITKFTGLLVLDFDHIENAKVFKKHLFDEYPFIISTWLSPSKKGIKALVRIPIIQVQSPISKSTDEFKEYFDAISDVMELYDGFDKINQNPAQPLFQSYDPELLFRADATIFSKRKAKPKFIPRPSVQPFRTFNSSSKKETIIRMIVRKMNEIINNGHPQLRRISYSLGGFVGGGYLTQSEAEELIYNLIEHHRYLCKGISGYKKTASTFIKKGMEKPLSFGY
jgi:hypothetical protein